MKRKMSLGRAILFVIMVIFSAMCIYPIIWLLINSLKDNSEIFINPWGLPIEVKFENYKRAIVVGNVGVNFLNSIYISTVSVIISILLSTMCSYSLVRMKWKLASKVRALIVVGMSIPAYAAIVPLFSLFYKLGIINEYPSVIIAHICFALPMSVFIISGFMTSIPSELEEAAIIDGCSVYGVFFKVIVPVCNASIATVTVINFITVWNDLLFPQIFLSDSDMMPLPVGLTMFNDLYSTDYVGLIAAVIITIIPTIIVYTILHDKIIEGMTAGAIKG
ncbi:MAG: carbohydrate ABC transporter permease [Bacillota bacterium]